MPHSCPITRRLSPTLAAMMLAAPALGCREDAAAPTAPEATALDMNATQAPAFIQLSAGNQHTCGVATDNRAYCWGWNSDGQLGDGTTTNRLTPVAIGGTLRFRQVSASFASTCGVTTDFRAYCWGTNDIGQLGDGSNSQRLVPVPVAGGHRFRNVETRFQHTCGVSYPDNRAYCWGSNREGELGIGNRTGPETGLYGAQSTRPIAVLGTLLFRQVTAGYHHSCGVTTDDRLFCWGYNRYGQVGDSSTAWLRLKPSQVAGTRRYRQVDAGRDHTCAVTIGYRAFCWGAAGRLGNRHIGLSRWPLAVAGGLSFERVTAGAFHSCGEATTNRAYCWGANGNGSLGDGTRTDRLTPVAVVGGLNFSQLSAGGFHSCGRTPGAVAWCWGRGFAGQLGNGAGTSSLVPVAVSGAT